MRREDLKPGHYYTYKPPQVRDNWAYLKLTKLEPGVYCVFVRFNDNGEITTKPEESLLGAENFKWMEELPLVEATRIRLSGAL